MGRVSRINLLLFIVIYAKLGWYKIVCLGLFLCNYKEFSLLLELKHTNSD